MWVKEHELQKVRGTGKKQDPQHNKVLIGSVVQNWTHTLCQVTKDPNSS